MNFREIADRRNRIDRSMTFTEVIAILGKMLDIEPTSDVDMRSALDVDFEPAWAIGARLRISREADPTTFDGKHVAYMLRVEVSFSSSHFTPAQARARAIVIGQVADMACFAEACAGSLRWDKDGQPFKEKK